MYEGVQIATKQRQTHLTGIMICWVKKEWKERERAASSPSPFPSACQSFSLISRNFVSTCHPEVALPRP